MSEKENENLSYFSYTCLTEKNYNIISPLEESRKDGEGGWRMEIRTEDPRTPIACNSSADDTCSKESTTCEHDPQSANTPLDIQTQQIEQYIEQPASNTSRQE